MLSYLVGSSVFQSECLHRTANNRMQIRSGQRVRASSDPGTARKTFIGTTLKRNAREPDTESGIILLLPLRLYGYCLGLKW